MKPSIDNLQQGNKVTQARAFIIITIVIIVALLIINHFHPGLFKSRYLN